MFVRGKLYNRRNDIQKKYGGQRYGGISTPAKINMIFLFTGKAGKKHGYEDRWSDDGEVFLYYGEGQVGDMEFVRGNLAIRDHSKNAKDLHLFKKVGHGCKRRLKSAAFIGVKTAV